MHVYVCEHMDPEDGPRHMQLDTRFDYYSSENVTHSIKNKLRFDITHFAHFFVICLSYVAFEGLLLNSV